jgi:guanylate kinase
MVKGTVFVISGPSGVGKGTLINRILEEEANLYLTVSATTRKPRNGEKSGRDYFFLSKESFEEDIEAGKFVEWCEVHGNRYGTYYSEVERFLAEGKNVLLEIDTQGARKIRAGLKGVISILIAPPSLEELRVRLVGRATEDQSIVEKRLLKAEEELADMKYYDYVVVNDNLDEAVQDLLTIFKEVKKK